MTKPLVLVTGGNGFLALHVIQQLLAAGYPVRATVRSLEKAAAIRQTLASSVNLDQLTFVALDLTQTDGWQAAMRGVTYVMSVAAPVFVAQTTVTTRVQTAAETGTVTILKAAAAAGVKRVIMTANLGAVGFSHFEHTTPVTEVDWTKTNQPGLSAYEHSKLLAERAAWDYVATHPGSVELTTVNAGAMLGPALNTHVTGSYNLLQRLIDGKAMPNLTVNVVDVRDVARLEILAMVAPQAAGERYLAVAPTPIELKQVRQLIQKDYPQLAEKLTRHLIPTNLVKGLALVVKALQEPALMLRLNHNVSIDKARTQLGWQPRSSSTAVRAALTTLARIQ